MEFFACLSLLSILSVTWDNKKIKIKYKCCEYLMVEGEKKYVHYA